MVSVQSATPFVRNVLNTGRAFATVETIASRFAIQYNRLLELSAQQLISCDIEPGELNGCEGGTLYSAFETVKQVSLINLALYEHWYLHCCGLG